MRFHARPYFLLLSAEDIEAISKGYEERNIICNALLRELREPQNSSDSERLGWLSQLIASGILEIKVAFTPPKKSSGMYHEKIGVIYDESGNKIAFAAMFRPSPIFMLKKYQTLFRTVLHPKLRQ